MTKSSIELSVKIFAVLLVLTFLWTVTRVLSVVGLL